MTDHVVAAGRIVSGDLDLRPGWLAWSGDRIVEVGAGTPPRAADHHFPDHLLTPGLVDVHVHGGNGSTYDDGEEAARRVASYHHRSGSTSTAASLVSAPLPDLERSVRALADLVADDLLLGVHLEGPWLSERRRGAHDARALRTPDRATVARLLDTRPGTVGMVTLAPELDGGLDAVRQVADSGARAAIGHTDATYEQTIAALDAGVSAGTHVFNAMRPLHHRDPGPTLALLQASETYVEVIADGVHLHPATVRHLLTTARLPVLVSDSTAAAGRPDGRHHLGGLDVEVRDGVARLVSDGSIAGSSATLAQTLRHAVLTAGVPLPLAVRAATEHPARLARRPDLGVLAPGARADAVLFDADLRVHRVLRRGAWLDI